MALTIISVSRICVDARFGLPVAVTTEVRTAISVVTMRVKAMTPGGRMSSMATMRIALQPRGSRSAELTIDGCYSEEIKVVLSIGPLPLVPVLTVVVFAS